MSLRQYQQSASDAAVAFLTSPGDDNGLLIEPTGSGKSHVIADIVSRLPGPSIVFQPSKEILEQNYAKFAAAGYFPRIYSASAGEKRVGRDVTLATIGSVVRKPHLFNHVRYIIVDEAHGVSAKDEGSMYVKFFSAHPGVRILGLTATPYRLVTDGYGGSILKFLTRTRPRVFTKVVHVTQNGDLFRDGFLCRLEYKAVKTGFNKDRLRLNTTGADYTDESVREHFKALHFDDQIVRCCRRLEELGRGGALVFTRFVEEARYVASRVPGAAVVTADTPKKEREHIIAGFKSTRIPVVANVGVLALGFDFPALRNIVIAAPTRSLVRYYQFVGRGIRPHPSKDCCFVVDMVGLVEQFGKVEDLKVVEGPHEKWHVESNGRQLTNVYYGQARGRPEWLPPVSQASRSLQVEVKV